MEGRFFLPLGLGEDGHAETLGLEQPRDHRVGKAWVIDISVATDEHKVDAMGGADLFSLGR